MPKIVEFIPPRLALIWHTQVCHQHSNHAHMEYEMLPEKGSQHLSVYCYVQQSQLAVDLPVNIKQRRILFEGMGD